MGLYREFNRRTDVTMHMRRLQRLSNLHKVLRLASGVLSTIRRELDRALAGQAPRPVSLPIVNKSGKAKARAAVTGLEQVRSPPAAVVRSVVTSIVRDTNIDHAVPGLNALLAALDAAFTSSAVGDSTDEGRRALLIDVLQQHAPTPATSDGREHALVFSTSYKYKGGERPTVVAVNMGAAFDRGCQPDRDRHRRQLRRMHADGCLNVDGQSKCACADFNSELDRIGSHLSDERRRLAHVTLTRARCELVVFATDNDGATVASLRAIDDARVCKFV